LLKLNSEKEYYF